MIELELPMWKKQSYHLCVYVPEAVQGMRVCKLHRVAELDGNSEIKTAETKPHEDRKEQ